MAGPDLAALKQRCSIVRKLIYGILLISVLAAAWYVVPLFWFLFHGRTSDSAGSMAREQLEFWTVPAAAQLTSAVAGRDWMIGQTRIIWFNFRCDPSAFNILAAAIIAEEETRRSDSGVISVTVQQDGSATYTIGERQGVLQHYSQTPDWWPEPSALSGSQAVEIMQQSPGSDIIVYQLYYNAAIKNGWLNINM